MTLFDSDSQFREAKTIWRILGTLPLNAGLAQGQIYSWYAVNIPMNVVPKSKFTSDIDIIGCFRIPMSSVKVYRTWEVKVSLLASDGSGRSLKSGKTKDLVRQLNAYKNFGSPYVTILESYICQHGFLAKNKFPTDEMVEIM